MTQHQTSFARVRLFSFFEGASLLVLIGIAVPLKHWFGMPKATTIAGSIHGVAFVAYVVVVLDALATRQLSRRQAVLAILAAVVSAGSFVFRRSLRTSG